MVVKTCWPDGRPPRVRGRRSCWRVHLTAPWKTPAGAGTTRPRRPPGGKESEDPRGCGDDSFPAGRHPSSNGRPPRVRGRHVRAAARTRLAWKTPAGAGTTSAPPPGSRAPTEDPRGCGDDDSASTARTSASGRPPRVRGRRDGAGAHDPRGGKTPAGAGTTSASVRALTGRPEDPRGCGDDERVPYGGHVADGRPPRVRDDWDWDDRHALDAGRPPRVRGRPTRVGERVHDARKTPAGAGTTPPVRGRAHRRVEDPRGCGDDPAPAGTTS